MKESLREYCQRTGKTHLLDEWDIEKNKPLSPAAIASQSNKKVWWRCSEGHEWQARISDRVTRDHNCPYCSGHRAIPGETDLATLHPDIAAEWHPTKNGNVTPDQVTAQSNKKYWWRCDKGHEWQATVNNRVSNHRGCPYCSGAKVWPGFNDLATTHPDIAAEWHPTLNGDLKPTMVTAGQNKKVWWICPEGHPYQATIANRTTSSETACPYCASKKVWPGFNDLASRFPAIARQWHPTKNGDLTPDQVTFGSGRKVWWRCGEGHEWQATIHNRTGVNKTGCPVCATGRGGRKRKR